MNLNANNNDISNLKKELSLLNEQRTKLIFSIVHGKPMIHGMPHEVFRRCGKKNCKCSNGRLHGPYPALSINRQGKQKIVMIKKDDISPVLKKSKRYRFYQQTLAKIRKINREIDRVMEEIKSAVTIGYP